jgi:hypothetical protein
MVGLGEERDEILSVLDDLRRVGVSILTIGQYLRPSATHAPMKRYYHPDEFGDLKQRGAGSRLRARRVRSARAILVPRARTGRRVPARSLLTPLRRCAPRLVT